MKEGTIEEVVGIVDRTTMEPASPDIATDAYVTLNGNRTIGIKRSGPRRLGRLPEQRLGELQGSTLDEFDDV